MGCEVTATYIVSQQSNMPNTGSSRRDDKESGKYNVGNHEGNSKALVPTGRIGNGGRGVVVGAWESHVRDGQEEEKTAPMAKAPSSLKHSMHMVAVRST